MARTIPLWSEYHKRGNWKIGLFQEKMNDRVGKLPDFYPFNSTETIRIAVPGIGNPPIFGPSVRLGGGVAEVY